MKPNHYSNLLAIVCLAGCSQCGASTAEPKASATAPLTAAATPAEPLGALDPAPEIPWRAPVDEDGWTILEPSDDSLVIYVAADGDDANDGLSPETPKKTIQEAKGLLRHGFPDHLRIRRGDVFREGLGNLGKSGRSASERLVVEAWGDAAAPRPILETNKRSSPFSATGAGSAPPSLDYVAIVGLHFRPQDPDGDERDGIGLLRGGRGLLLEDLLVEGYMTNVVVQGFDGPWSEVQIRRSTIVDAWAYQGAKHSQGIFASGVDGLLIEECTFDHNGWREDISGARADIFRHNAYLQRNNANVVFRGNISAYGASHGVQQRTSGFVDDNFLVGNAIGILGQARRTTDGGLPTYVRRNVVLHGRDIADDARRGWGIDAQPIAEGFVEDNLLAFQDGHGPQGIAVSSHAAAEGARAVVRGNVLYEWGPKSISMLGPELARVDLIRNRFYEREPSPDAPLFRMRDIEGDFTLHAEGNRAAVGGGVDDDKYEPSASDAYVSLRRDLARSGPAPAVHAVDLPDYHRSIGGEPSIEAFLREARLQRRGNWRREYTAPVINAWFRAQYGMGE